MTIVRSIECRVVRDAVWVLGNCKLERRDLEKLEDVRELMLITKRP